MSISRDAHLHRIQTLFNELGVSVTPAAEAPRVDVDGRSELNTNQTSAKLSHESVLFNMLLTKLQTDLNTLE